MTAWLLDDGPFGLLASQYDDAWTWPAATVHVVHEVASAAASDRSGRRQKLLQHGSPDCAVTVHRPLADGPAAKYFFEHVRPKNFAATKNLAEDMAIAIAATEFQEAVFVTLDKWAAFVALAELGRGRVATPLDAWADLHARGRLTRAQFEELMTKSIRRANLPGTPARF